MTTRGKATTGPPDTDRWVEEVKKQPDAAGIGMVLVHRGVVRGTSRAGEPVTGMRLSVDRVRLEEVLTEARAWPGIVAVRGWVNEGRLAVGDDIMTVLVAGDIRENVFSGLRRLVGLIKTEVVTEEEERTSAGSGGGDGGTGAGGARES